MSDRTHHLRAFGDGAAVTVHSLRSIDAEVRYRNTLKLSEAQLRAALEHAPSGMALLDPNRRITEANHSLAAVLDVSLASLRGKLIDDFVRDQDKVSLPPNRVAAAVGNDERRSVFRVATPDGNVKWCTYEIAELASIDGGPAPAGFVCQVRDVTHDVLNREELEFRAAHDRLTGLINRDALEGQLAEVIGRTTRTGNATGVLFLDVDNFKEINDAYGHKTGDIVLKVTAERIVRTLRPSDIVARIGGDEIVIILESVHSITDCIQIGDMLRFAAAKPIDSDGAQVAVSVSIGAALAQPTDTAEDLLDRADAALYRAKTAGRDRTMA